MSGSGHCNSPPGTRLKWLRCRVIGAFVGTHKIRDSPRALENSDSTRLHSIALDCRIRVQCLGITANVKVVASETCQP
jgi:hypothetical protein